MPDIDSALAEVRRFGTEPPVSPSPVERLAERAAQRRRRRRVGAGVVACVAVAVAGLAVAPSFGDDEGEEVRTADAPEVVSTTSTTDAVTTTARPAEPTDLVVEPRTDLVDGQVVSVSGPFDLSMIQGIAICDAEGVGGPDATSWCDINVVRSEGASAIELTVVRRIQTGHGLVDCAERPGRCVVGVRTSSGGNLVAPISFRDGPDPLPVPRIDVEPATAVDGEEVRVLLSGFHPAEDPSSRDAEINLVQCLGTPSDDWGAFDLGWDRCDTARAATVVPDADGEVRTTFTTHADILTYDGWQPCDPCVLVASAWRQPPAVAAIDVTGAGPPIRPTLRIAPEGPYEPGQRVRLEGSGFGAGNGPIQVGWCAFRSDDPATEVEGDPSYGYAPCGYPTEGMAVVADAEGSFVVEDYPLPDGGVRGFACGDPAIRCGLAWHPGEGTLPVFVTLFELRPQ